MALHLFHSIVIICIIFIKFTIAPPSPLISFRIVAPQTICKEKEILNNVNQQSPQSIAVNFQPRNDYKFKYKFQIFFKTLEQTKNRSQRRTLQIWKAIRSLEQRLNNQDSKQITERNALTINQTELVAGVNYIFQIYGLTKAGEQTSVQNFSLKFTENTLSRNDENLAGMNLLLLGTEQTISIIPYVLVARATFCDPTFHNYHFQWMTSNSNLSDYFRRQSSILKIPENLLVSGVSYRMTVEVLQSNDSKVLGRDFIDVSVTRKDFTLMIIPTLVQSGLSQPISIEVIIQDYNSLEGYEVSWECVRDNQQCTDIKRNSSIDRKLEIEFSASGTYEISANVKIGKKTKSIKSIVVIKSDLLINYEIPKLPVLRIQSGAEFQLNMLVSGLLPGCIGNWTSIDENNFSHIEDSETQQALGNFLVKDIVENFLSEIADFGNSTVSQDTTLRVPPAMGSWQGLVGDSKYKFQMIVNCPNPFAIDDSTKPKNISSVFELVIETNLPPVGAALEVKPLNGSALSTTFQLTTGGAKDKTQDSPLYYEFMIEIDDNYTLTIGSFYEHISVDTLVPYSEHDIKTFYRVCDIHLACSIVKGNDIKVNYLESTFAPSEIKNRQNEIENSFRRMDFETAENQITMYALTYQKYAENPEIYEKFKEFAIAILSQEIFRLFEEPTSKIYIPKEEIVQFINLTRINFEIMNVGDPKLYEKLIELLHMTSEENNVEPDEFRAKRSIMENVGLEERSVVDSGFFEMALNLMEKFLRSLNETSRRFEKIRVVDTILSLTTKMCSNDRIFNEHFFTDLIGISLEKMSGSQLVGKNLTVPRHYSNRQSYFTLNLPESYRKKYLCLIFFQFPEDYFSMNSVKNVIYNIQIFELIGQKQQARELESARLGQSLVNFEVFDDFKVPQKCEMMSSMTWSPQSCRTFVSVSFKVACSCSQMGYLKIAESLDPIKPIVTTEALDLATIKAIVATEISDLTTIKMNEIIQSSTQVNIYDTTNVTAGNVLENENSTVQNIISSTESSVEVSSSASSSETAISDLATIEISSSPLPATTIPATSIPATTIPATTTKRIVTETKTTKRPAVSIATSATTPTSAIFISTSNPVEKFTDSNTSSASVNYIAGFVGIAGIILVAGFLYAIYHRRKRKRDNISNEIDLFTEPRQPKTGIAYATFYDEHLLNGEQN